MKRDNPFQVISLVVACEGPFGVLVTGKGMAGEVLVTYGMDLMAGSTGFEVRLPAGFRRELYELAIKLVDSPPTLFAITRISFASETQCDTTGMLRHCDSDIQSPR